MVTAMHSIRGIEIALVLIAAWLLAGIIMQPDAVFVLTNNSNSPIISDSNDRQIDLALIKGTALFGAIDVIEKIKATPVKTAPVAAVKIPPLALKLWGTVVAGDSSIAILAVDGKPEQKIFHLHETIADGVTLELVWADAVEVLDHAEKRRIELRKPAGAITSQQLSAYQASPLPPVAGMVQRNISRKMINRQTRNFSTLLSQARVIPHFANGKADGFVINNIVPNSLFQQIGLRNGDIIRKVNQKVISSAAQAMQLYQSLQKAAEIQLEVERAGQIQTINYHIQ